VSFAEYEIKTIQWAEARRIIPNSTPLAQAIKTLEEVTELLSALHRGDREEMIDAYGDVLVTLIIGADLADLDLTGCLEAAYAQIKDRRGTLRADGVFVKEAA
jgi:NTP pyrophosphatase (non-canonical NTP hydrolase)